MLCLIPASLCLNIQKPYPNHVSFYHIHALKHIHDSLDYSVICIPSKYISRLQRIQNTLARDVGGSHTPSRTSNMATLSQLHWLPIQDRIKFKIATMTHKAIPVTPNICLIWSSGTLHPEVYGLPLPTFSLSLVVTSHLVLEVFARQLLLFGIVCLLTFGLAKLSQHSADT